LWVKFVAIKSNVVTIIITIIVKNGCGEGNFWGLGLTVRYMINDVSVPSGISLLSTLLIAFLNHLLDGYLCYNVLDFHILSFLGFQSQFYHVQGGAITVNHL